MNNIKNKRNLGYSEFNVIFILFLSIISILYLTIFQKFIPIKFHLDSETIQVGLLNPSLLTGSIKSTVLFFKFLGFTYFTPIIIVHFASWLVLLLMLFTFLRINNINRFSYFEIGLIIFFVITYGCYFGYYSKDIICILFFLIAINLPPIFHHKLIMNIILIIGIYGLFFRYYWMIVFILSLICLSRRHIKIKKYMLFIVFCFLIFIIFHDLIIHGYIMDIRIHVDKSLIQSTNANAMIKVPYYNSSIITDCMDYLYVLVTLVIPIQGFPSINVIVYYLWVFSIIVYCFMHKRMINWRIMLILFIYINVQALFEPNFGSVLRHQLAWSILLYYTLNGKEQCE